MLDTHLTETEVTIGATRTACSNRRTASVYARIIGVKEWMGFQEAALDVLVASRCGARRLRDVPVSRHVARERYIKKIRGFYKVAAFNPVAILKQWATKEEQKNDEGRELLAKEAGDALAKLDAEGQQYGFANISIVVYGSTPEECEDATRQVVGVIGNAGFGVIQEKTTCSRRGPRRCRGGGTSKSACNLSRRPPCRILRRCAASAKAPRSTNG